MTANFPKLLGLALIVMLQAGCRPHDAPPEKRGSDGSETFTFNPDKNYAPAPQQPPEDNRADAEHPRK